ncbi:3-hydroxyacyl-[acyl-carrier-protein] dehydratase FabZ [Armatimonadota bacterium]|nr:3-hydroxyacyl-ACP dehydratase FabZ [Armatimonadota bacterium]GDX41074.1 3-hydroxyacyl-[acyl-carrier-protein] dehydratase FabZ [Armatimonadota bacterium]
MKNHPNGLSAVEILKNLPHRFPMLLVDRVLEIDPGKRVVGIKNVSFNEPFFSGHFPGLPVMPGVLIIESMAQVAAIMMLALPNFRDQIPYLAGMDKVRFRKPVVPGDTLRIEAELVKIHRSIGRVILNATVEGELIAEAELMFALKSREPQTGEEL